MQLIVRKTKSFILDGHETFTVNPGSEPLQVTDAKLPDLDRGLVAVAVGDFHVLCAEECGQFILCL